MDAYKTPASNLYIENERPYKPVAGILIGLCFSVLLMHLSSTIIAIIFGALSGEAITEENFSSMLAGSNLYLLADTVVSAVVLFFAGRAIGKRTKGKEIKFAIILALITLSIYLPIYIFSNAFIEYPVWYNLIAFISTVVIVPFGAKSVANT